MFRARQNVHSPICIDVWLLAGWAWARDGHSPAAGEEMAGQHQNPFLHHLPQWEGQSVHLLGTMSNIKNPFSAIFLNGKVDQFIFLALWTTSDYVNDYGCSPAAGAEMAGQHQNPFLHRLPQWKGLSVFLALWATSETLSPPSTSVERPVCLFGIMGNIKNPFSTVYLNGKACLSFRHYGQHQKPFLHHLPQWKGLSVFLAL